MSIFKHLPRTCTIEHKDFKVSIDPRIRSNVLLTEMGSYKSFSLSLMPISIDWIRASFSTLLASSRTNRFFLEQRFDNYILWIEKTSNRKGYIAELYKVDDRGRKSCILIPEGVDRKGWATFHNMLTFREIKIDRTMHQILVNKNTYKEDKSTKNRSYAEVLNSNNSSGDSIEEGLYRH